MPFNIISFKGGKCRHTFKRDLLLGSTVFEKQCNPACRKANCFLWCIRKSIISKLYHDTYKVLGMTLDTPFPGRYWKFDGGSEEGSGDDKVIYYEDRLNKLGIFSLKRRRLNGERIAMFKYLTIDYKEDDH